MTVWFSVVASMAFMYLTSPQYEWSDPIQIMLVIMYVGAFMGGMFYDSNRKEKINKLEREIERLKEQLTNK